MTDFTADDFPEIARRMREIVDPAPEPEPRKPECQSARLGCDWPDCPCGVE